MKLFPLQRIISTGTAGKFHKKAAGRNLPAAFLYYKTLL